MLIEKLIEKIHESRIIAAVRQEKDLEIALTANTKVVFILNADIFHIGEMVQKIKALDKIAFIHVDFVGGLGNDFTAIDYVQKVVEPDGIITTKISNIKHAKSVGLCAIQRFFLIDSHSYETMSRSVQSIQPEIIEIMPGIMPSIITKAVEELNIHVIAGGLIENQCHIQEILQAGALAASTSQTQLW